VVLLFNKTDLLDADELHYQQMLIHLYETIGYECRAISAETGEGIDALMPMLEGKITLLSGNSGVGKSTIINRLVPGVNLRTAEISDAHQMGQHTTTFSEMIPLLSSCVPTVASGKAEREGSGVVCTTESSNGWLIDTPGIKGFGTFDMEPEELTSYFREIFRFSKDCRFSNCTHTHEPGCAVLQALEDHYIAQSRYQSYLSMLSDKDDSKYREAY
jgi:ribosome biogenesis GTPase